jgi:hypothetical protein
LSQIEGVARDQERIGLRGQSTLEHGRIVMILSGVLTAAAKRVGIGVNGKAQRSTAGKTLGRDIKVFV